MTLWYDPFSYINIANVYLSNPYLFDSLILLTIFLGLSQYVFTKKDHFGKRHGKTLAIAISVALTLSSTLFLYSRGWNLATPGVSIIPFFILFAILYYFLFTILENILGMEGKCAGALAFLITYPGVQAMFANPQQYFTAQYPMLGLLFSLMIIVAVVVLIMCVAQLFPKSKNKGGGDDDGGRGGGGDDDDDDDVSIPEISFSYEQPKGSYTPEDTIILKGTISGGSGNYQYVGVVDSTGQKFEGTQNPVQVELENPKEAGKHSLTIIITDGKQKISEKIPFEITNNPTKELYLDGTAVVLKDKKPATAKGLILQLYTKRTEMPSVPIREDWGKVKIQSEQGDFRFELPNEDAVYEIRGYNKEGTEMYFGEIILNDDKVRRRSAVVIKKDTEPPKITVVLKRDNPVVLPLHISWTEPSGEYEYGQEIPVQAEIRGGTGDFTWDGTEFHNAPNFKGTGKTIDVTIPGFDQSVQNPQVQVRVTDGDQTEVFSHPVNIQSNKKLEVDFSKTSFAESTPIRLEFEITGGNQNYVYKGKVHDQDFEGTTNQKATEQLKGMPAGEYPLVMNVVDVTSGVQEEIKQTLTIVSKPDEPNYPNHLRIEPKALSNSDGKPGTFESNDGFSSLYRQRNDDLSHITSLGYLARHKGGTGKFMIRYYLTVYSVSGPRNTYTLIEGSQLVKMGLHLGVRKGFSKILRKSNRLVFDEKLSSKQTEVDLQLNFGKNSSAKSIFNKLGLEPGSRLDFILTGVLGTTKNGRFIPLRDEENNKIGAHATWLVYYTTDTTQTGS